MADALPKCRGCDTPLTAANDSEAHIIPNALGGHLSPTGLLCRSCNTKLDKIADNPLIEAFGDWPTLMDIPRDRGNNPPKLVETRNGHRVRVQPDGSLRRMDVQYDVQAIEDGHLVQIGAGDMKTFRQLLQRAEKQFEKFDAREAEQYARIIGLQDDDQLRMSVDFSPKAVVGGVVTAVWLYLAKTTGRTFMEWPRLLSCISNVQKHGGTWRYLIDGLPGLDGPDIPLGHKIIVRSVPSTGQLIAYVEILGILKLGGVFAEADGPSVLIEHIHAYDVLGRKDRSAEFTLDPTIFDKTNWKAVGLGPTDVEKLKAHFRQALEDVFVKRYRDRFSSSGTPATGSTHKTDS